MSLETKPQVLKAFRYRLADVAKAAAAPHELVLTDYGLSYVLAGVYAEPGLKARLAFKGGTALRKCYFRGYRFSQDLDFTLLEELGDDVLEQRLRSALEIATSLVKPYGKFAFSLNRRHHRAEHPFGQSEFGIDIAFPTGAKIRVKVEVTGTEEPIVFPLSSRDLVHLFPGEAEIEPPILCYSLEEIAVEKFRALLQASANYQRRDWINRPRDVYDIWYLYEQTERPLHWGSLREPLQTKAAARGLSFSGRASFLDERVLKAYQEQWEARLRNFARPLPEFGEARRGLAEVLARIFA